MFYSITNGPYLIWYTIYKGGRYQMVGQKRVQCNKLWNKCPLLTERNVSASPLSTSLRIMRILDVKLPDSLYKFLKLRHKMSVPSLK